MWEAIQYVSGSITLVAFVADVIASTYKWKIDSKEKLIKNAREEDRAELIRNSLEFFHVETEGLTKEQRYSLALEQIRARSQRFTKSIVATCFISVLSAIILLTSLLKDTLQESVNEKKRQSNLEVVEISTSKDTTLDLGLRNSGDLIAFVNGIQLVFGPMYCGSNVCMPGLGFTRYKYDLKLSNGKAEILHNASIEIDSKRVWVRKMLYLAGRR